MSTANGVSPSGKRVAVLSLHTQLASEEAAFAVHERTMQAIDDVICADAS
ncbi:hypothetical protein OHA21_08320 [Actinoplanes sp. NBC_00393]